MTAIQLQNFQVSLVIPMKNESETLPLLIDSIERQTFQPFEVVFVDGGSTDDTLAVAESLIGGNKKYKLIKTPQASPGKGRNIGAENAQYEWIAFTDAGIKLNPDWLERLAEKAIQNSEVDIVYGKYSPVISNTFEKIAALTYVPPLSADGHRGKSIASCLLKKIVWEKIGGFPDLRAAEDLMFMERAKKLGFKHQFAPEAMVYWQLRPDVASTFRKFVLYSKFNVWAGKQADWHYGIARQYLILLPFLPLAVFHSAWWLLAVVLWLFARTAKRILPHRREHGLAPFFNPVIFFGVMLLGLVIDAATFMGWFQAVLPQDEKKKYSSINYL
jgi:glycosyltransferase involved in cell wall biosynthesis